jgi:hypothetical protein
MSVEDRLAAARAGMAAAAREQREQVVLGEKHMAEGQEKAQEQVNKTAEITRRFMDHVNELTKRKKEAGGWLTEKSLSGGDHTMGLGIEDDDVPSPTDDFPDYAKAYLASPSMQAAESPSPPTSPIPQAPEEPSGPGEPTFAETTEPTRSVPPPPPRAPRGRHAARDESFDDDDFSNNSWMLE